MYYARVSGLAPQRRHIAPAVATPFYGLLDAFDQPELVPVAGGSQAADMMRNTGLSARPEPAGQLGLLEAFGKPVPRVPHDDAAKSDWTGLGSRVGDAFLQAGRDAWTGYRIGASGMYDTAGDVVGLINDLNDFLTRNTGIGQMSEGTIWKDAENWLHETAARVGPAPDDLPETLPGKVYTAIGQAPAEVAQYLTAARLAGPVRGLAGLGAVRNADGGLPSMAEGAIGGAVFGKAMELARILPGVARARMFGTLGTADTLTQGGSIDDVLANGTAQAALGLVGARPRKFNRQEQQLEDLYERLKQFRRDEPVYWVKKHFSQYFMPDLYRFWSPGFNGAIGKSNERLGRQTAVASGLRVGPAPRYRVGPREWRQGDYAILDEDGKPVIIVDAKYGRLTPEQQRRDKRVPVPTIYIDRDEIVRRAKELLKNRRRW